MTVATTTNKAIATGNGVTTSFPFSFGTLPSGDLVVTLIAADGTETVQVENTDYTVLGEGSEDGGAVVFNTAPANGVTVLIQRLVPYTQPTDLKNQGSFYPRTHERAFDRATMQIQQLAEEMGRSIKIPAHASGISTELAVPEAGQLIGWNEDGTGIKNFALSEVATMVAEVVTNAADAAVSAANTATTKASEAASSALSASDSAAAAAASVSLLYPFALYTQAGLQNEVYPYGVLPDTIVVQKKRADRPEFAVYTPLSPDGKEWCRWLFTNRFNAGGAGTGAPRMLRCSLAYLWASNDAPSHPANITSGTQAQTAVESLGTAGADSVTGSWTTAGTVNGVSDIRYSTTPGDKVVYTLHGVSRIAVRSLGNPSNGGIVAVVVKSAGVEIDADNYTIPAVGGERRIDYAALSTGQNFITVADGLPSGDYTVEISVSSANGAGARGYDGGVVGYAALAYNSEGRMGTWADVSLGGVTMQHARASGAAAIYKVTGTRIEWRYGQAANAGIAEVRVYDSDGVEIDSDKYVVTDNQVDAYGTGSALIQQAIAEELPLATYYLVVQGTPTKNASSSGYRTYDYGAIGYDTTRAGTIGADAFFDNNVNEDAAIEPPFTLIGTGNLEVAMQVCKTTETVGVDDAFVGGIHGFESTPATVTFTLDGEAIDFDGASDEATWTGKRLRVTCDSELLFPSDSSAFADLSYQFDVSRAGYTATVTRTMTADATVVEDYCMMFNVPNTSGGANNQGIGGGFEMFSAQRDDTAIREFTSYTNLNHALPYRARMALFFNDGYIVTADQVNADEIVQTYDGQHEGSRAVSFVQERTDDFVKWYNRAFSGSDSGVLVKAGDTYTHRKAYRVMKRYP